MPRGVKDVLILKMLSTMYNRPQSLLPQHRKIKLRQYAGVPTDNTAAATGNTSRPPIADMPPSDHLEGIPWVTIQERQQQSLTATSVTNENAISTIPKQRAGYAVNVEKTAK
jgi:hypothetical protein